MRITLVVMTDFARNMNHIALGTEYNVQTDLSVTLQSIASQ